MVIEKISGNEKQHVFLSEEALTLYLNTIAKAGAVSE